MANRPLAQRTETDVVLPDDHKAEMWETGASLLRGGLDLKQKYDQAQMNNFAAQSQIEIQKVTQEWRVKNEGNPMDDKAIGELNQSYDKILGQYDDKIGFLSRADWGAVKRDIKTNYQEQNQKWGFSQSVTNAQNSVNESIKINNNISQQYGIRGDYEGFKKHYVKTALGLDAFANDVLGEETKKNLTKDYRSDSMKSFILGQATSDPDKALTMLNSEEIINNIGNKEDITTIKNFAIKQKKVIQDIKETNQINNGIALMQEFSKKPPTAEDIPRISEMGAKGDISQELAQASVRYITSPESVDDYEDKGLVKYLDAIFDSKDKKAIEGAVTKILEGGSKGSGSPDSIPRLVMVASNRSNELDTKNGQGVKPESKQGVLDGVYQSVKTWIEKAKLDSKKERQVMRDFLEEASKATPDTDPRVLYNDVVRRAAIREYPEVASQVEVPTMVYSQDDNLYTIFNSQATVSPHKIYDPKSKTMVNNPNREITNK